MTYREETGNLWDYTTSVIILSSYYSIFISLLCRDQLNALMRLFSTGPPGPKGEIGDVGPLGAPGVAGLTGMRGSYTLQ